MHRTECSPCGQAEPRFLDMPVWDALLAESGVHLYRTSSLAARSGGYGNLPYAGAL
jgi:hypothetical protein